MKFRSFQLKPLNQSFSGVSLVKLSRYLTFFVFWTEFTYFVFLWKIVLKEVGFPSLLNLSRCLILQIGNIPYTFSQRLLGDCSSNPEILLSDFSYFYFAKECPPLWFLKFYWIQMQLHWYWKASFAFSTWYQNYGQSFL